MYEQEKKPFPKFLSVKDAKEKLYAFCAYQERTQKEARTKLYELGQTTDDVEEIIADLVSENFINEERFAISYAGGKFRIKKWGKMKIIAGLKSKGISDYCLRKALDSIDEDDYKDTLIQVIEKKAALEKEKNVFRRKDKIARYAISRGFEPDVVWTVLNETNP